jgi:hypothetical protein
MTLTQIGAFVGSLTGIASLSWNVYVKSSAGPKLRVQAFANMVMRPAPQGDPRFMKVFIQNVGTTKTTITNYSICQYPKRRRIKKPFPDFTAILNMYEGPQLPYKLDVGEEATVLMRHDIGFEERLNNGRPFYFAVSHAFSTKPVEVRILAPEFERKQKAAQAGS